WSTRNCCGCVSDISRVIRFWYPQLSVCVALTILFVGCSPPPPGKSPSTAGDDVLVHQGENKPSLVHIERAGDSTWALAATFLHGGDTATSIRVGEFLRRTLEQRGLP